ncbi:MAG: CBS domain-containing protein [Planctomycetes bacterium]|nr:CBS domain-containing protein [Planctomycetota bacterium]
MIKVKDVMTRNVIYVKKDTPVIEAIQLMAKNDVTGVPVVEDDMTPAGVLSEQDVLRLLHTYRDEKDRTAGDFMSTPAIHFDMEEPLLDACFRLRDKLKKCSIRRVLVTSQGKVVGIISRSDILVCILNLCNEDAVLDCLNLE